MKGDQKPRKGHQLWDESDLGSNCTSVNLDNENGIDPKQGKFTQGLYRKLQITHLFL